MFFGTHDRTTVIYRLGLTTRERFSILQQDWKSWGGFAPLDIPDLTTAVNTAKILAQEIAAGSVDDFRRSINVCRVEHSDDKTHFEDVVKVAIEPNSQTITITGDMLP